MPDNTNFRASVIQSETKKVDNELSLSVEYFLKTVKNYSATGGFVTKYCISSKKIADFIIRFELTREKDIDLKKFTLMYFCFNTIAKIVAPPTAAVTDEYPFECYLQSIPESRFIVDVSKPKIKDFCDSSINVDFSALTTVGGFGYYTADLGTDIYCEDIVPSFFASLGSLDKKFIDRNPDILKLESYKISIR